MVFFLKKIIGTFKKNVKINRNYATLKKNWKFRLTNCKCVKKKLRIYLKNRDSIRINTNCFSKSNF